MDVISVLNNDNMVDMEVGDFGQPTLIELEVKGRCTRNLTKLLVIRDLKFIFGYLSVILMNLK